ncbi:MAG: aldehyde ferredoxin oxidoreductase family protein [Chloroflexi bacterium]|nr:aldehyde ferredoxin oxidoreductase family protein [Chloroflexota bacterium]
MLGWMGQILDVNLSTGAIEAHPLDLEMARQFVGGRGLGARLLWDLVDPRLDPLSPDNVLVFATGPLTATAFPTSNRFTVSTKSPLTGTILDANAGGFWGMRFKRAGYDALIVRGRAPRPMYLEITRTGPALKPADHLWGKTVFEATAALGQGRARNVLCIGPAGERLVRIAAIMNDASRSLARGGPGAVMGSKQLKAIVVEGDQHLEFADREYFKFVVYESSKHLKASPLTSQALPRFGTAALVNILNLFGALPARNFQLSQFADAEQISGEALTDQFLVKNTACWACPIACIRQTRTARREGEGPEYESIWALGAACGVSDLETIVEANYLCNELGLDTISTGATIACAMELVQRGTIPDGPRFGQAEALPDTIRSIARREGLGDELAEGSRRFAERHGVPECSMSVKGLELPAYDPRGMQGQGLLYATSNRGGCHLRGNMLGPELLGLPKRINRFQVQGKASIVSLHQNSAAAIDSLVLCKFCNLAVAEEFFARVLTATTGIHCSTGELLQIGERVWNLERLFNLRAGFTRADDTLPPRLLQEPVADGPSKGWVVHLEEMLEEYYRGRGWDRDGVPTPEKLHELGLSKRR